MDFENNKQQQRRPQQPMRQQPEQPVRRLKQPPQPQLKPKLAAPVWRVHRLKLLIGGSAVLAVLVLVLTLLPRSTDVQPQFTTVLPAHTSIHNLGGWKDISPPEGDAVFAYSDSIDGVAILVSQQPLPNAMKQDREESLRKMAESFHATDRISGTPAYIGTSAKGPQSVLVIRKDTLVMIKSEKNIAPDSWAQYIQSLR